MQGLADRLLDRMRRDRSHPWPHRLALDISAPARETLTEHEVRVLSAYSCGMRTTDVSDVLGISLDTVKTHTQHARRKLCAKNTTHAVANAIRGGMI